MIEHSCKLEPDLIKWRPLAKAIMQQPWHPGRGGAHLQKYRSTVIGATGQRASPRSWRSGGWALPAHRSRSEYG